MSPVGRCGRTGSITGPGMEMEQLLQASLGEEEGGEEAEGPEAEVSFQDKCRVGGRGWNLSAFFPLNPSFGPLPRLENNQEGFLCSQPCSHQVQPKHSQEMRSWIVPTVPQGLAAAQSHTGSEEFPGDVELDVPPVPWDVAATEGLC